MNLILSVGKRRIVLPSAPAILAACSVAAGTFAGAGEAVLATALDAGIAALRLPLLAANRQETVELPMPAEGEMPRSLIVRCPIGDLTNGWAVRVTPNTGGDDLQIVEIVNGAETVMVAADIDWGAREWLENGGFESPGQDAAAFDWWAEYTGDGAIAAEVEPRGCVAKVTAGPGGYTILYRYLKVTPGDSYVLSFWTRGEGQHAGRYEVYSSAQYHLITPTTTGVSGTEWQQVEDTFTVPPDTTQVGILLYCPEAAGASAYYDDVSLKRVSRANNLRVRVVGERIEAWVDRDQSGDYTLAASYNGMATHCGNSAAYLVAHGVGEDVVTRIEERKL